MHEAISLILYFFSFECIFHYNGKYIFQRCTFYSLNISTNLWLYLFIYWPYCEYWTLTTTVLENCCYSLKHLGLRGGDNTLQQQRRWQKNTIIVFVRLFLLLFSEVYNLILRYINILLTRWDKISHNLDISNYSDAFS